MSLDGETRTEPHAHKTGRKWVDMTVAFSALFVSVVSLGVAMRMADANARRAWCRQVRGRSFRTARALTLSMAFPRFT
jgi:hypothetical protein